MAWFILPFGVIEDTLLLLPGRGDASILRCGVGAGVRSVHVTSGRVSYCTVRRETATDYATVSTGIGKPC